VTEEFRSLRRPDGASIAYGIVRGNRPRPLLALAHGMGSNLTRWSELFALTALKSSWDLLRVDLRGHGDSPWRGRTGMDMWIDDLAAILDKEGYERAVVGGNCLGANFALHFAHRRPERTRGLALIEPIPRAAQTGALRALRPLAPLVRLAAAAVRTANSLGIKRRRLERLDLQALDIATRAAMTAQGSSKPMTLYASPLFDLRYMGTAAYLRDLLEVWREVPPLAALRVPVLALISTGRQFTEPALVQQAIAAIPRLTLKRIDALHWIPTEQPRLMREAIEQWCENLERLEPSG
jgi:pimeloyl-ACP methyl ester carboxylesterase